MKHQSTWNKVYTFGFFRKAMKFLILHTSMFFLVPPSLRPKLLSLCGVIFDDPKSVFIGTDVLFDNLKNTKTTIGKNVTITTGVKIINHFPILTKEGVTEYEMGDIVIKDNVFIGMNALIIKPITIGKGAVVGAGAVVTKDIPDGAIVGGNPAVVISYIK